jgi:tetratricopeptide (TPR) repeat protein
MKRLLFFLPVLLSNICMAQLQGQPYIDSLLPRLPYLKGDTIRLKAYYDLANAYKTINPNEGIKYATEALAIAEKTGMARALAAAYKELGINYYYKGNYIKAIDNFNKALIYCNTLKKDNLASGIVAQMAIIYQELGQYDKALQYYQKALQDDIANDLRENVAGDYGNIGIVYLLQKNYPKALEYDEKSLAMFTQMGDNDGIAHNYGNIGNVYKEMGNHAKALEYDQKALSMFRTLGDNHGIALNLGNMADACLETAKILSHAPDARDTTGLNAVLIPGNATTLLRQAISYYTECLKISREIDELANIHEFSKGLSDAYMLSGNHAQALEAYKQHILFRDSVLSDENRVKIARLETEREQALKEKQIEINSLLVAAKTRERIMYGLAVGLLVLTIGVVTNKFLQQKRRNRRLAAERKRHLEQIEKQKIIMGDIAYAHSHDVSGQVATILGLASVLNTDNFADTDNKVVIDGIVETAQQLDIIVKDMIVKENQLHKNK